MLCDSHIHLGFLSEGQILEICENFSNGFLVSCAQDLEDFERQQRRAKELEKKGITIICALGIHPLYLNALNLDTLDTLLKPSEKQSEALTKQPVAAAVGEVGLDFYTKELKDKSAEQENIFALQLEFAIKKALPVVIHSRKALQRMFYYAPLLKQCKAVVFHGFEGSANEAKAFLKRGVNAYFGIGKTLLKGDKSAAECVKGIEKTRLLFETDSPYQRLKGEEASSPVDVEKVIAKAREMIKISDEQIIENFKNAFDIH